MELRTIDQLSEVAAGGTPVQVVDPKTQATFVLRSAEQFEKVRPLLGNMDVDVSDAYPLMDEVAASEGWNDPEMDIYNPLRESHP